MMDVCLEVSGAYAHLVGVDTVNSLLPLRRYGWRPVVRDVRPLRDLRDVRAPIDAGFEDRLSAAIDRLPFLLAHVLWLVDVCGSTYETAAVELGMAPERVEGLMAEARHQLRDELVSGPRRSPEESTSPFQPAWRPPDR